MNIKSAILQEMMLLNSRYLLLLFYSFSVNFIVKTRLHRRNFSCSSV